LIYSLLGISVFTGILVSIFVYKTINDIPIFRLQAVETERVIKNSASKVERDTLLRKEDISDFWHFTSSPLSLEEFLITKQKKVNETSKGVLTTRELKLPPISLNECDHSYCYQRRLPFGEMPSVFWKGLIGIEDSRFLKHFGIDLKSIFRAIVTDIKEMRLAQGGSTLTQQLVKNLFYSNEKSFRRKIKEIIVAIYIETKFSKEDIISSYFNEVFWGSFNGLRIKGLYSASIVYFGKKPNQVDPFEASILISLLKGPYFYSPIKYKERLITRTNVVFNKLVSMGLFSKDVDTKWTESEWDTWIDSLKERTRPERLRPLVYLSKNVDNENDLNSYEHFVLVKGSHKTLKSISERYPEEDFAMKIVMGALKGDNYFSYYSKWERDKIKAISNERHSVGSTLKPIFYTFLTYMGLNWEDKVETGPVTLKLKSGSWSPRESHKVGEDYFTVARSLQESLNRPLVRLSNEYGFDELEKISVEFLPGLKTPLSEYPSQLLGSIELSTYELFQVYRSLFKKECKAVLSEAKKWEQTVQHVLSDPRKTTIRKLVAKDLESFKFFGKTGTSNNGYDNWFVFYDGLNLGVIWTGVESKRSGKKLKLYGGTTSYQVFQDFLLGRGRRLGELGCEKSE
jgi:penicillin-binding protein 1B